MLDGSFFTFICCKIVLLFETPQPQVRIPSVTFTLISIDVVQIIYLSLELECGKNDIKQKEAVNGPLKNNGTWCEVSGHCQ